MKLLRIAAGLAAASALLLSACGGGGGIGGTGVTAGTLRVGITDAPACGFDEVNVTIEKVRVHQSSSAGDNDAGWSEVVLNPARRLNLLDLSNGVIEELGETPLPSGTYTQMRLVLAPNSPSDPLANSVLPTGGTETALDTPSGQQSGLKLNVNIDVPAGQVADVVLDFDACKSVVRAGSSGKYNLKPVISVIPRIGDAGQRVVGWVDTGVVDPASTLVSLQADDGTGKPVVVKSTAPDGNGNFVLYPVPEGIYDLVVSAAGHAMAVMTGVPVTTTEYTYVNSAQALIAPSASAMADVTGTVSPATATVRALQSFDTGPTVEAAFAPVAADGTFAFSLPVAAPEKTDYVPSPASVDFVTDPTAEGLYKVEAASGTDILEADIDVTAPVAPLSFVFP